MSRKWLDYPGVHTVIQTGRDTSSEFRQLKFDPTVPLPNRRVLNKHDPSSSPDMTTPMKEKLLKHFPGHFGLQPKEKIEWHVITLIELNEYKMFYSDFSDNAVYY